MAKAKTGDTVKVHYRGELLDGTVFDSSSGRDPLEFTIGEGNIIPGFEQAVIDMSPGESKTATIPVDMAYGPIAEEMIIDLPRASVPDDIPLDPGTELQMRATMVTQFEPGGNDTSHGMRHLILHLPATLASQMFWISAAASTRE